MQNSGCLNICHSREIFCGLLHVADHRKLGQLSVKLPHVNDGGIEISYGSPNCIGFVLMPTGANWLWLLFCEFKNGEMPSVAVLNAV